MNNIIYMDKNYFSKEPSKNDESPKEQPPKYYQIRKTTEKTCLDIYITDLISDPAVYSQIITLISRMEAGDEVHCYIHTDGGYVATAAMFTNAMQSCAADCIGHTGGKVISAGTMILSGCNKYDIHPKSSFLFHQYAGGKVGKVIQIRESANAVTLTMKTVFNIMLSRGFITEEEWKRIVEKGEDVYISGATLISRFSGCETDGNGYIIAPPIGDIKEPEVD